MKLHSPSYGLEQAMRGAYAVLFSSLNAELSTQTSNWAPDDEALAAQLNVVWTPTILEHVENRNFYLGHRPSLIEAPVDRYPNVSVMASDASPGRELMDQINAYDITLVIEAMAKADDEGTVNKRITRMADAVTNVVARDRTLSGATYEMNNSPNCFIADVFARRETSGHGNDWYWQGCRIEISYSRYANLFN